MSHNCYDYPLQHHIAYHYYYNHSVVYKVAFPPPPGGKRIKLLGKKIKWRRREGEVKRDWEGKRMEGEGKGKRREREVKEKRIGS